MVPNGPSDPFTRGEVLSILLYRHTNRTRVPGSNLPRSTIHMFSTYEFLANWLRARFGDSDRGAALVEYALLVALIAVVCILAITRLGKESKSSFQSTSGAIADANGG
jgi:pilus assembly protein Flp/PilA